MSPHPTEQLSAYLDGELPAAERATVEAHLLTCATCTRAVAEMRAIDAASRRLPVDVPEGYFEALPGRVRGRLQPRRAVPPRRALWAVAAAAVLAAVVSPFVLRQQPAPAPLARQLPAAPRGGEENVDVKAPPSTAATAPPPAAQKEAPARRALEAPRVAAQATVVPATPPPTVPPPAAPPAMAPPPIAAPSPPPSAAAKSRAAEEKAEDLAVARDAAPAAEPQARRDRAARRAPAGFEAPATRLPRSEEDYAKLAARRPKDAAEARALRESWRAWANAHPEGAPGDEARVRALEAGAEAWRLGRDPRDLARLRQDAEAYLQRPDALQKDRVRALLEKAGA
jgi:anti-sigma factor RsiW